MGKWKAVAVITVILMIIAAAVVWFVFNKASKTLDKANTMASATDRFTANIKDTLNSGKRIWELFSEQGNDVAN